MKGRVAPRPTLLHVVATPHPPGVSRTRRLAGAFLEAYAERHPGHAIEEIDLAVGELPEIDAPCIEALFGQRNGCDPRTLEARRRELDAIVAPLLRCDALLVTSPMWNFTVPYRLKHWLDLVMQPGRTFRVEGKTVAGLLAGRRAVVLCSRSFLYGAGTAGAEKNHFEPYLATALGFIGLDDLRFVTLDGADLPGAEDRLTASLAAAREAAMWIQAAPTLTR